MAFCWGSRIKVPNGTTLRSSQTFGDGILRITAQMTGNNTPSVGLSDGNNIMLFQVDGSNNNKFIVNNNGSIISGHFIWWKRQL